MQILTYFEVVITISSSGLCDATKKGVQYSGKRQNTFVYLCIVNILWQAKG
jgi:hypothetical protein